MSNHFSSAHGANQTGVYVGGILRETFAGNDYLEEQAAIRKYATATVVFYERIVGGNGKVRLSFRLR